ncbi:MAG: hypothetical protein A2161_07200 [Candidatus Schekmanbacteria bacterium RBG_13_48_7]|uniref:Uncharacterized protein n=1 Tax=Candidatus Schekmanbacteria bacterium RBG_13_48_7 TaxID=1817878 RepID=A0A1F7S158_9BACT|nr:MAG: hypothetical protein A2161_07200 [Candidatus Schekmanbacteria bacterium RBG_13_48_7]
MKVEIYCNLDFEGKPVTEVTIRAFKGKDRSLLGQYENNLFEGLLYVIANCITEVNGNAIDNAERKRLLIKRMERGDIFNLLYAIKKESKKGNAMIKISARCRNCGFEFQTEINSDELERKENRESKLLIELPEGFEKDGHVHKVVVMTKPTGELLIKMDKVPNNVEATKRGVISCVERVGEINAPAFTILDYDELSYTDIEAIETAWVENTGGVALRTEILCENPRCRKPFKTEVNLIDFFV